MKEYAEKGGLLSQLRRCLYRAISWRMEQSLHRCSFLFGFGTRLQKNYRFLQYTPMKCFNNFVQSLEIAGREGDENPKRSVVAETMKLLLNSSYGYQIVDWSRHTVKK